MWSAEWEEEVRGRKAVERPIRKSPWSRGVSKARNEVNGRALVQWMAGHPLGVPGVHNERSFEIRRGQQVRSAQNQYWLDEARRLVEYAVEYDHPALVTQVLERAACERMYWIEQSYRRPLLVPQKIGLVEDDG